MFMLLAAALASPAMPAGDQASRTAIEAYVRACEDIWATASVTDKSADVGRCIADDYRGVTSRGNIMRLADATRFDPPGEQAAAVDYVKIRFPAPTVAIAQGEEWHEPGGGAPRWRAIWTDTWLYRAGRWQIVASQDSPVALDKPLQKDEP